MAGLPRTVNDNPAVNRQQSFLAVVSAFAVGEELLGGGEQMLFPILDEGRMHAEAAGVFVDGFVAFECSKCYLSLERRCPTSVWLS